MKKIKIKWRNILKLLVMLVCLGFVLYNVYMLTFYSLFTGQLMGWTWTGFFMFILAFTTLGTLCEDLFSKELV